jgi:hypothetical protein
VSTRLPGLHPGRKPVQNPQIDYRDQIARGLVGSWLMENSQGSFTGPNGFVPERVQGLHGNLDMLGSSWALSDRGSCLRFTGVGDSSVYLPYPQQLAYGSNVSVYVRARPTTAGWKWFYSKIGGSWFGYNPSGLLSFTITAGTDKLGATNIVDSAWHSVGFTLNNGTLKLYLDGKVDNTYTSVTPSVTTTNMYMAHRGDFVENYNSDIDCLHHWSRTLEPEEMLSLHESPYQFYTIPNISRYISLGLGVTSGQFTAADTGTGADAASFQGVDVKSTADTGSGVDAASLITTTLDQESDTGSGTDSVSVTVFPEHGFLCTPLTADLGSRQYRWGPEHYLPSWTTAHAERTGKLFQLLQHLAEEEVSVQNEARRASLRQWLIEAEVGEQRIQWGVQKSFPPGRDMLLTFSATVAGSVVSGSVRQATSPFDFDSAVDPVWYAMPSDLRIWVRNLHMRQGAVTSPDGVYSLCEEFPVGLVPDTGIFFRRSTSNNWEWMSPESAAVTGVLSFSLPSGGPWQIAYGSQSLLTALNAAGTLTASWIGGQTIPMALVPRKPYNVFDGYGSLIGIPRFLYEDNLAYKRRLLDEMEAPGDPTVGGVVRGICSRLGQLNKRRWDGASTLTLDTTGASGITHLFLPQVDQYREVTEQLAPSGGTITPKFLATYGSWRNGWLVLVDGVPEANVSLSSNIVTLSRPVSGAVTATYSVQQYRLTTIASGYIGNLEVGTGLASGSYSVFLSRYVDAHVVDLPDYQRDHLLDATGLPNQLFLELARKLTENNPTAFGRARWGLGANWFDESEDQPPSARLPIPMDTGVT